MARPARQIIDRIGLHALRRVLDDVFDPPELVNLANSCGLEYRGMRTQSQRRDRLLADLVDKAGSNDSARTAILRALRKQTATAAKEWQALSPEGRARRLVDGEQLCANGKLGLYLFLVAGSQDASDLGTFGHVVALEHLRNLAGNGNAPKPARSKSSREDARLKKQVNELEKKARHLEGQLSKSRQSHTEIKQHLIQRKGELAEARMLAERLRKELADAEARIRVGGAGRKTSDATDRSYDALVKVMRKLEKRVAHLSDRKPTPAAQPSKTDATVKRALRGEVRAMHKDLLSQRAALQKQLDDQTGRFEDMRAEMRAVQTSLPVPRGVVKRRRTGSKNERVGVFIDVQNVYYGARRLKGKLDFDAMMNAAVSGRRLIQATAYVVESKEADQSQFIAVLQNRAIEVRRKALQVRADGSMKGDWDMELALDILDSAPRLDVVVLVSGDGDFTALLKRVKSIGPRVEVISFPRNTAKSLVEAADRFEPLDRKFMIYARPRKPTEDARARPVRTRRSEPSAAPVPAKAAPPEEKPSRPKARTT